MFRWWIGKRVERRRQRQGVLKSGVDRGEVRIDVPAIPFVRRLRLDPLAQRVAAVLKEFMSDDRARDIDNIVGIERVIDADAPVQKPFGDIVVAADSGLEGVRDDLLEIRVADQRAVDQAGTQRIGACEFKRRRRAVRFRIAAVDGDVGRHLVGCAGRWVEAAVIVVAIEQRVVAQFVLEIDLGEVETAARGHRQPRCQVESIGGVEAGIEGRAPSPTGAKSPEGWSMKRPVPCTTGN